ncbi:MAG: hypothetical protein ACYC6R_18345 [Anaerolineales bacterium]
MNIITSLILGILIGWLIEWAIDWFYWRTVRTKPETPIVVPVLAKKTKPKTAKRSKLKTAPLPALAKRTKRKTAPSPATTKVTKRRNPLPPANPDDLTAVKGIEPAIAWQLNKRGIYTYEQLADLTEDALGDLLEGFFNRPLA